MPKNTLDRLTRSPVAKADLSTFAGKVGGIMAAPPGPLGGLRAVRKLLTNLGFTALLSKMTVRSAFKAFAEAAKMIDAGQAKRVEALGAELAEITAKLMV